MATTGTLIAADPKHYVWWFPGSPVKVQVNLQVVHRLRERLRETGPGILDEGLLFGRVLDGAVEILDFQPASGRSVPNMIAELSNEQSKRSSLMGYYRTEDSEAFHLNAKDISLADEYFRKPYQVFMMIHSDGFAAPNATFFFHDGDRKMADFAFLEFPFDPSLLAIEERDRIQRSREAVTEHSVEASLAPVPSPVPSPRSKSWFLLKITVWTCSIAIIFALGTLVNNRSFRERLANFQRMSTSPAVISLPPSPAPQPSSPPSMELHAKRQNGDLELTWKRESALIANATSGVILIQDGKSDRRIPLDSTQVHGGSLLYSPISDQILMQMTIPNSGVDVTESVMVILPKFGALRIYSLQLPTTASAAASPSELSGSSLPLATASKPFSGLSLEKEAPSLATPLLPDSPALKTPLNSTATVLDLVPQARVPPPLPVAPSQQLAPTTITYQPAVAIRKATPAFPTELKAMIIKRTVIEVNVTIDKNGAVTKAEAVPQKNVAQLLVHSAVNAAQLWKFQPARRGDDVVSSEAVLQFVFTR